MFKKTIINEFSKDGFDVSLLNIDYKKVSICLVSIDDVRKTYCKIKNSPIFYYVIEGTGFFKIDNDIEVNQGDLIEIPENIEYTYKGKMKMLEVIPNSFEILDIEEKPVN